MVIQATWEQQRWAPHCHVRKEPLPRARHHTATSERNPCHAQETTLPRQKQTPATHKTLHCHMVDELLPRDAQDTKLPRGKQTPATPGQDFASGKNKKKTKRETNKQQKKHKKTHYKKHVLRPQKSKEKHSTNWRCTWQNSSATRGTPMLPHMSASQHQSRIGECQILRVGPFFMVEDPPNSMCFATMVLPVCVVLCVSWSCGCRSHWNGCMNVAWALFWGGSRSTKPCVFPCKVAAAADERYLVCAAVAAAVVWFLLCVLQQW